MPREKFNAILLAGGKSGRMQADKSLLSVGGQVMVERMVSQLRLLAEEVIISATDNRKYSFLNCPVICDTSQNQGPLMGMVCALAYSKTDLNFVIACDIPEINGAFLDMMLEKTPGREIVVPVSGPGLYEPLFAFYRRSVIFRIQAMLAAEERKISPLFSLCKTEFVPLPEGFSLTNLNTRADFLAYIDCLNDGSGHLEK